MSNNLSIIKVKMARLNSTELKKLIELAEQLKIEKMDCSVKTNEELLYDRIFIKLNEKLKINFVSYEVFKKDRVKLKALNSACKLIDEVFLDEAMDLSKKIKIYDFFIEAVIYSIEKTNNFLTLSILLKKLNDIPSIIDDYFPGYHKSGILFNLI